MTASAVTNSRSIEAVEILCIHEVVIYSNEMIALKKSNVPIPAGG